MQTPGPPGRWGAGGADADVYLMSWAGIWFTLGNQTVYRRPHLCLPLLPFHFSVMFCRSASGPRGRVSGVTRITPCQAGPAWGLGSSGLGPGCGGPARGVRGVRGDGEGRPRGRRVGAGPRGGRGPSTPSSLQGQGPPDPRAFWK